MRFNCFRPAGVQSVQQQDEAPRPKPGKVHTDKNAKKRTAFPRPSRNGSSQSRASSNSSISQLPPVARMSDPEIEKMMMPVPTGERPSRCLRMSHPKIYSDIVSSMKECRGCRDWRNFAVFHDDEIDMKKSAEEYAYRKRLDYERKIRELSSFSSGNESVDMIG